MFLCEAAANQLQQSKGCCGVRHVLGSVHHWLARTGIRALNGEIAATSQVQLGIGVRVQL